MVITELKNNLSTAKEFKNKMLSEGRKYSWAASNLKVSVTYICNVLNEKERLTEKTRSKLNQLLNTDY